MPWMLLIALLAAPQPPPAATPVTVFVVTEAEPNQPRFNRTARNAMKQIRKELGKYRGLKMVNVREGADVEIRLSELRVDSYEDGGVVAMAHRTAGGMIMAGARPTYTNYATLETELVTYIIGVSRLRVQSASAKDSAKQIAEGYGSWLTMHLEGIRLSRAPAPLK